MEFKAIPRTIGDTLELKRRYIIPRFQREYSWESDELNELWDDLLDNIQYKDGKLAPSEYFIGSLVLVGDDDDNINIDRQVVDGQQRLMTITIAFSVLSQLFLNIGENKLSEKMHLYIMGEDTNGDPYTKLLSETPKPFFQYRIQMKNVDTTRVPSTQEEKRILAAYLFFERKLTEKNILNEILKLFQNSDIQITYVDALKLFRDQILNCKVIYVTVKSFEDGYAIFEVLNAKGKDLTPVDMIKNSLFSILNTTEPLDFADEKWKSIRNSISKIPNGDMLVFYRHYWLSKYNFSTTKRLVKEFNEQIEKKSNII